MRKPMTLGQHGNSIRLTFPPPSLRYLKWGAGTEVMFEVIGPQEIRIVSLDQYMREHVERERAETAAAASGDRRTGVDRRDRERASAAAELVGDGRAAAHDDAPAAVEHVEHEPALR